MTQKCSNCKLEKSENDFIKNNKILKTCILCREKKKEWKNKNIKHTKLYSQFYNSKKDKTIRPILIRKKNSNDEYMSFNSLKECCEELGLQKPNLHKLLNGKLKSTGGYEAKYGKEFILEGNKDKTFDEVLNENNIKKEKHISEKRVKHETKDGIIGKKCCKCKEWIALENYSKLKSHWDGYRNNCKECNKKQRLENKDKMTDYNKKYWIKTKDKQLQKNKEWRLNNKEKVNEYQAKYMKKWDKKQREINPQYKLIKNLRSRLYSALKGRTKSEPTKKLLGCEIDFLKKHLENKFDENMNWENYGSYWHVDHIIPCSIWNLENDIELKACCHYTNLQPMEASENESKNNKCSIDDKNQYLIRFINIKN